MFFGISGFGLTSFNAGIPFDTTIESVQLSNSIVDEIKIDANLDIEDSVTKDDWSTDTMLLAEFQNNLEGGNVSSGQGIPIQKLRIKRRLSDSLTWETMTELDYDESITNYVAEDYYAKSSKTYYYKIIPCVQNLEGTGSQASIKASYDLMYLSGYMNGTFYNFTLRFNLKTSDITTNDDKTYVKTLSSKYPAIMGGKSCYKTGTIEALLLSPTSENTYSINIDSENEYRDMFEAFLENSTPKLIRNHSLFILGDLSSIKKNPISDDGAYGVFVYNINFTEVADTSITTLKKYGLTYNISLS